MMPSDIEIELNPIDFVTVGTVGPKGKRTFHIQGGQDTQIVTLTLEKEQARALGNAIEELLDDLQNRYPEGAEPAIHLPDWDMNLRDPVETLFRIAQIGLGYDEKQNQIVIIAQELVLAPEDEDPSLFQPRMVRFWGTRAQFRALSLYAAQLVKKGRSDPKSNGRLIYYWT